MHKERKQGNERTFDNHAMIEVKLTKSREMEIKEIIRKKIRKKN